MAAALAISPIPHRFDSMTSRRIPLGDVPNATNSPARHHAPLKRPREHAEAQENFPLNVLPHAKRPAIDPAQLQLKLSTAKQLQRPREDRLFAKPNTAAPATSFERRLLAAKEADRQQRVHRNGEPPQEDAEDIRKWQHHYRKAFPGFVFYFEGLSEDVRMKCSKCIRTLGAREEKFFSREVTHLVTNRPIPTQSDVRPSFSGSPTTSHSTGSSQPRTINPAILEKSSELSSHTPLVRARFDFAARIRKVPSAPQREVEQSKPSNQTNDLLLRAQGLGIKIWHLNKLERIVNTIYELPSNADRVSASHTLNRPINTSIGKGADLSRLIKNERLHGPSDRAASTKLNELISFRGPFLLVRDIDEVNKPIMVREWPKPTKRGDSGEWPQFRANYQGKCPFVPEAGREEIEKGMPRPEALAQQHEAQSREPSQSRQVSRAATPQAIYEDEDASDDERPVHENVEHQRKPLQEVRNLASGQKVHQEKPPVPKFCHPSTALPHQARSPCKDSETKNGVEQQRPWAYEPAASGVQPSNITSAIRSQVISSTTGVPFVKAGTSKEVHGLKRKVLEKNVGSAMHPTHSRTQPVHLPIGRAETQIYRARQSKPQSKETLTRIHEESGTTEGEEDVWLADDVRAKDVASKPKKEKSMEKEGKPGYCENCREKYNDFDEHVQAKRHRKFALDPDNWKDLDKLLNKLARPLRIDELGGF